MAFERFTKIRGRSFVPKVGIWARGQIGFNKGAMEKFRIQDYDFAVLFFDEEERKIGIKLTNDPKEEGANKIIKRATGSSFSANAFLNTFDIKHDATRQYDVEFDETEKLLVVQLEK